MIVGILQEIKTEENRVCMTPAGVEVMIQNGHTLLVEKDAGASSGFGDEAYVKAGAKAPRLMTREMLKTMKQGSVLGANVIDGQVTYQTVAEAFGMDYTPIESLIGS